MVLKVKKGLPADFGEVELHPRAETRDRSAEHLALICYPNLTLSTHEWRSRVSRSSAFSTVCLICEAFLCR